MEYADLSRFPTRVACQGNTFYVSIFAVHSKILCEIHIFPHFLFYSTDLIFLNHQNDTYHPPELSRRYLLHSNGPQTVLYPA